MLISPAPRLRKSLIQMPRPTSFGKDTGLQVRMAVTIFLLGLVYVVLAVTLLYFLQSAILMIVIVGGLAAINLFA